MDPAPGLALDDREAALGHLRAALPGLQALYLFGSAASGEARPGSDLDLALLADRPLAADERFDLEQDLALLLGREVDLVDLLAASTVMRMQVISTGRLLWEANRYRRELFEVTVYSAYARLNEERRGILEDIRREGRVYG